MLQREQVNQQAMTGSWSSIVRRWAEYLVAILAGNIIYLYLEPQLPSEMRHRMFRVDWGLAIDFLICVAAYGVVRLIRGGSGDEQEASS